MGIFSRFKDIVSANLSSMLDRAEDPEKMIRLMIREMEETLVEIKASCAGTMAASKRIGRELDEARAKADLWAGRAELAVERGREDMAREALLERRRHGERVETLEDEKARADALVDQARADIGQLEEKLEAAKEKQRLLIQRHKRAAAKHQAQGRVRAAGGAEAMVRFERYEQRIERLEAEAGLVNPSRPAEGPSLEDAFRRLEEGTVDEELAELKRRAAERAGDQTGGRSGGAAAKGAASADAAE
ncbi:MAG: PspA/IM30 family protein [Desulfovibrionaceae bacterium]|jgi:phage shock protein A|nr:PspA/IM30 family protein [Desulfovibrionaceae bacterium]